uniref:Bm5500 n=1 Tax=Brugia malayi TaxID=6279 RepID=A0A0H5SML0_BRUMA|nr:Bm5500 [Brugia malayi]
MIERSPVGRRGVRFGWCRLGWGNLKVMVRQSCELWEEGSETEYAKMDGGVIKVKLIIRNRLIGQLLGLGLVNLTIS